MVWIIIFGVIAFCITLFLWRNSYQNYEWTYRDEKYDVSSRHSYMKQVRDKKVFTDRLRMPLWTLILLIIGYITPILNFMVFAVTMGVFAYSYSEGDIYLHLDENSTISKILNFFNKDVF